MALRYDSPEKPEDWQVSEDRWQTASWDRDTNDPRRASMSDVGYTAVTTKAPRACGNCAHFTLTGVTGEIGTCAKVAGAIDTGGICKLYQNGREGAAANRTKEAT